jgi:NAD(P)H-nitrite reductase large subunit
MPYDRTKVSKGFLAGALKADGLAVNMAVAQDHGIAWRTQDRVMAIDTAKQVLQLADGTTHPYHALLLATGAAPKRLNVPGASLPHVHVLRTQDDAKALIKACGQATQVVIVGGSFIGLEAAAALCAPSRTITVITPHPDAPMAGVLGDTLAQVLFEKHKGAGIHFKQGRTVTQIAKKGVTLDDGTVLACDQVLLAVGVAPNVALAKSANLPTDDGILVSQELQTCAPQIWAAGDVARYATGTPKETQRIEHWAVAMRMGQVAADNMLGDHTAYTTTPYFWTAQHGINIRYVGHAPKGSQATVYGDFNAGRGAVAMQHNGRIQAVATVGCDPVSLACEAAFDEKAPQRIPALLRAAF